ncbi:MAG: RES family NAD+ phosphorylase [Burkholderiaceae bacterium]|nr:RES family NAD+ phosphorylase [Burkholderiaceae bacterium]
MLDDLAVTEACVDAVRLATASKKALDVLEEMGLDPSDAVAVIESLGDLDVTPDAHIAWVFRKDRQNQGPSRFSDGSVPVLYTALEIETAQAEMAHYHLPMTPSGPVYLRSYRVAFEGTYKSLIELRTTHLFLTAERETGAYVECQGLARAAVAAGLDALEVPSARHATGRCFPIFSQQSVVSFDPGGYVQFEFDESSNSWRARSL